MSWEWWFSLWGVSVAGLLTSISPCPMMTNLAAISYIAQNGSNSCRVLWAGIFYASGRCLTYTLMAFWVLSFSWSSGESLIHFWTTRVHGWLGPVLIIMGMFLAGMLSFSGGGWRVEKMEKWVERLGLWGAFVLGILFSLAFCPTSAVTYLTMLGIAAKADSPLFFPMTFGLATAFPIVFLAAVLAFQTRYLGNVFQCLTQVNDWMRGMAAALFVLTGIYVSLLYVWS